MKQLFKKVIFYLFIALLFYGCAEEKEFVNKDRNLNFDFKEKSFKEALALPVFNNAYQKVSRWKDSKKNKSASRTALEDEFGFTIVEDAPVRIITDENGTIFYTILIERELKEELKFENLLIKVQNDTTTAAIFKYTLTEKGVATSDNHYPIKDISNVTTTDLNLEGRFFFNSNGDGCNEISVVLCSQPGIGQPPGHIADSGCWNYYSTHAGANNIYLGSQVVCISTGGGGGGSTPTGSGNGGGTSSNNTGGLGASGGDNNPPPITSPTSCRTGNCIEDTFPKPTACDELKKEIIRSKNAIDSLKLNLNLPGETGKALKKDIQGNYSRPNLPASENNKIVAYYGQDYIGSIHVHPVGYSTSFSFSDIYSLYKFYEYTPTVNNHEVKIILVCRDLAGVDQVYSLVITNPNLLLNSINAELNTNFTQAELQNFTEEEDKLAHMLKKMDEKLFDLERAQPDKELIFLKKFKDYGIKLYKANETLTNWNALTLQNPYSDNPTKLPVPCPN